MSAIKMSLTFSWSPSPFSLSVGSVWVNSHSVSDPCMPVSGHKDSGTCTDGGQEVGVKFLHICRDRSHTTPDFSHANFSACMFHGLNGAEVQRETPFMDFL